MAVEKYPYVVIFIPAHNEEESIGKVIKTIHNSYINADKKGYWIEVIVVDDGSTDQTAKAAKDAGAKKIISYRINRGLGAATRTGLQRGFEMGADIVVKIDADFQHDPEDIDKVIRPILQDEADCVFGNRFAGGLEYKMPFHRALGNRFFSRLVSFLTGVKINDAQTGLMAFSRRYLAHFEMISDYNETQQLIMDAIARHMRIIEVPVVFHKRQTGTSFISWRYPVKVIPTIIRLFVQVNPLKIFLPAGLFSIILGGVFALWAAFNKSEGFFGDATISILIVGGIQIILFGLIGDMLSRKR